MVSKYLICGIFGISTLSLLVHLDLYPRINPHNSILSDLNPDLKNILVWTNPTADPIMHLGSGVNSFISRQCPIANCYVSPNRGLFKDVSSFDAVVFHGPEVTRFIDLPQSRSPNQKYIFTSMESASNYLKCSNKYNDYFNWTWTYKLNSDLYYGYIIIRNKFGEIIGPREEMHWENIKDMKPIDDKIKAKLSDKKFAVAWFVSHCSTQGIREKVAKKLIDELAAYNMTVDIYGKCGKKSCPRNNTTECLRMLERDYYFYLAFENSLSDDYVTEKLLHALQHYTVPVVYGGANYTRFMPKGIYLNVQDQTIMKLAKQMVDIINDKEKYYNFFKWHNSYSYHATVESPETDPYCNLCAMINNEKIFNRRSAYYNFASWWNPRHMCIKAQLK